MSILREKGVFYVKNSCNILYFKLQVKYFLVEQLFLEKHWFVMKLQETVMASHLTIF